MKNIFKFMGIALMACSLTMVACSKDDENTNDSTNDTNTPVNPNPNPNPNPEPGQGSLTINWGGEAATIGYVDAYNYGSTVYIVNAAAGMSNDEYTFPMFRLGLDLDTDPTYGCAMTAKWGYGSESVNGNTYFPTDVIENTYYTSQNDQTLNIVGDWWLDQYTVEQDYTLANAQFDPNALTLTASTTLQMFDYAYVAGNMTSESTNEEVQALLAAATKKNMAFNISNYEFTAATSK